MAKTKKETFAEMFQSLQANKVVAAKDVAVIEERKYFLIVTEGERTEPNYFNYFANFLPPHFVETINVHGEGDNTTRIVQKAIALRNEREKSVKPKYDEVWAVYDKDDFPEQNFNNAMAMAQENNIYSAHSNQSFELWYVLHFQLLENALQRDDYIKILTRELGFKYEKKGIEIMPILFNNQRMEQAIRWAKKLDENAVGLTPSQSCPTTKVYKLVENLMEYIKWK
jgi:hypothetical protein